MHFSPSTSPGWVNISGYKCSFLKLSSALSEMASTPATTGKAVSQADAVMGTNDPSVHRPSQGAMVLPRRLERPDQGMGGTASGQAVEEAQGHLTAAQAY